MSAYFRYPLVDGEHDLILDGLLQIGLLGSFLGFIEMLAEHIGKQIKSYSFIPYVFLVVFVIFVGFIEYTFANEQGSLDQRSIDSTEALEIIKVNRKEREQ